MASTPYKVDVGYLEWYYRVVSTTLGCAKNTTFSWLWCKTVKSEILLIVSLLHRNIDHIGGDENDLDNVHLFRLLNLAIGGQLD